MRESAFQTLFIKELRELFPGCIVLKNDPNYLQGFPDYLILYKDRWAALEFKQDEHSILQPNQDYYVDLTDYMSYGSFVNPENKERVLNELQRALRPCKRTRISKRI